MVENITKAELNFDGSEWENLREIGFAGKQLERTLTISGCPKLETINCAFNSLTKIDLSSCKSARMVGFYGTRLTELNFSNNKLTEITWPPQCFRKTFFFTRSKFKQ